MKFIMIGAFCVLMILESCQSEEQQDFKRYYNGGRILYEQNCQNCHSAKGDGLLNLIPPLNDAAYLRKNKAVLACMVRYGIKETIITVNGKSYEGAMPRTDLAPIDIAKVLTYITNSFGNNMGIVTAEKVNGDLQKCK